MAQVPAKAMVLGAGLGLRMRPLTLDRPKPLVALAGKPLIDHVLDALAAAGIELAVVNGHYLSSMLEQHVLQRARPRIIFSDETDALLDTGGGVLKALPHLGDAPFIVHNSDSVSLGVPGANIRALAAGWDGAIMDALLLLVPVAAAFHYLGRGDFDMAADGRLLRRPPDGNAAYVFAGVSIMHPRLLRDAPAGAFSLNLPWNRAIDQGRLYGVVQQQTWLHIGSPDALIAAERLLQSGAH